MAKSKPRKKTNKQGRRARFINRWLIGLTLEARDSVGTHENGDSILSVTYSNGRPAVDCAREMQHELINWQHHWCVTVFCEAETPEGDKYTESTEFEAYGVKLGDLQELVVPELDSIKDQVNPNHYKDHGWRAVILPNRKHEAKKAA